MAPKSQLLSRWLLILQCYQFSIKHRPGKANANADALSRCPLEGTDDTAGKKLCPTFIEVNAVSSENDLAMTQDEDEEIAAIRAALENGGDAKKGAAKKGGGIQIGQGGTIPSMGPKRIPQVKRTGKEAISGSASSQGGNFDQEP